MAAGLHLPGRQDERRRTIASTISPIGTINEVVEWFIRERGITGDTLWNFGTPEHTDGGKFIFAYPEGIKVRTGILEGERGFYWGAGSKQTMLCAPVPKYTPDVAFITEGETDAMRLWQTAPDVQVFGLPGIEAWKSEWAAQLANFHNVYVILDNDADYNVKARVDSAWLSMRRDIGPRAKRIILPQGIKDVCEFFQAGYDLDDLRTLVTNPPSRYTPLNLMDAHKPRPVNWMVDGLLGQGDIAVMIGDPYAGKSWLTMDLALALIQGRDSWMGLPLSAQGKVLYVDEENPEDVVYDRFHRLGLTNADVPHLRFLHEQGIRLDRDPGGLLQEAMAFEPTLIVIDSLTRVHSEDEQNAGVVARLFNDGIKPLSRQTGATVVILHHTTKAREGGSYARARGSGDITAAPDVGLDVRSVTPGYISLVQYKSRRRLPHPPIDARIMDTEDGKVRVVANVEMPPPF